MLSRLEESLQQDIDLIRSKILEMGELVERALKDGLQVIRDQNVQLANAVMLRDRFVDALELELDTLCQRFLIKHVPAARHMRFIYSVIKINNELERIGDYAESIVKKHLEINSLPEPPHYPRLVEIGKLAIPLVCNAVKAFADQDPDLARATRAKEKDKTIDNLRNEIHYELIQEHNAGRLPSEALMPLLTIVSRFERAADQAGNICEEIMYMCLGEETKHQEKQVLHILFVDERDACRAQMAEGIGNALGLANVHFSSAGVDPAPVDPRTVEFMAEKGIDISQQAAKYLNQVLDLTKYDAVISLCKEAEHDSLPSPSKVVRIRWELQDPSRLEGSDSERLAAYEKIFQRLSTQIQDFVQTILGEPMEGETDAT